MKPLTFLLLVLFSQFTFGQDNSPIKTKDFLGKAVEAGLQNDKFPLELAEYIRSNSEVFFVPKCPICTPVKSAFAAYIREIKEVEKKEKTKVKKKMIKQLRSKDKTTQQLALKRLIGRYSKDYLATLALPEAQQKELMSSLEADRKTGMSRKKDSFGEFCPSCDGACEK